MLCKRYYAGYVEGMMQAMYKVWCRLCKRYDAGYVEGMMQAT